MWRLKMWDYYIENVSNSQNLSLEIHSISYDPMRFSLGNFSRHFKLSTEESSCHPLKELQELNWSIQNSNDSKNWFSQKHEKNRRWKKYYTPSPLRLCFHFGTFEIKGKFVDRTNFMAHSSCRAFYYNIYKVWLSWKFAERLKI